ncbi:MAG: hypothetical protein EA369_05865 [Bradymonadales bacterium]|nr:MAG: hypothetical protein EA369_05865 [Bradymonadales bacterium]
MISFQLFITAQAEAQIERIMKDRSKKGLQTQLRKSLRLLSQNPKHSGLRSHPLQGSQGVYGEKLWTSYIQNNTPQAYRMLWYYGPSDKQITLLAVIPHY